MSNREKYIEAFTGTFLVEKDALADLKYQDIAAWDSVGHMALIAALEEYFRISIDIEDIIDISSYEKGMEILGKKYNVVF